MALPIPVEEAVTIATFPFIVDIVNDKYDVRIYNNVQFEDIFIEKL